MLPKNKKPSIIGVFEGECADSNITNENGLDIKRPVWELLFASEEYKQALKLGWYIGFLGHPEDPGCMDFEHACIVMTDGSIDAQGKVHGKFNLIDTPVGRIVKAFIDAGVTFGISVRGVGDIVNNEVDPETFIFRGFDLVAFPAFPESIPVFTEIAASTDINDRKKYKAVCAAIQNNIKDITDNRTLKALQSQFASQSVEYKMIQSQMDKEDNILAQKLEAMTSMYVAATSQIHKMALENNKLKIQAAHEASVMKRRKQAMDRITASQLRKIDEEADNIDEELRRTVTANKQLRREISALNEELNSLKRSNLKYEQRIQSATKTARDYERIISSKDSEIAETVSRLQESENRASNLDVKMSSLKSRVEASERMCEEYRNAYAQLYSNAAGVDVSSVPIKSSTSISALKQMINSARPVQSGVDVGDIESFKVSEISPVTYYDENDLVTL